MIPDIKASLGISHTQTTNLNQQGAVVSTGINFSPLPQPQLLSVNGSPVNYSGTMWGVVAVFGLGFVLMIVGVWRRR